MALIDFTLSNARRFYSSMGNPSGLKGLNHAYIKSCLSITQRRGIITLIPKKHKPVNKLKNWRPFTLLNYDYKIASKCIANRIQKILPKLINNDQTGFLKGRVIGENMTYRQYNTLCQYETNPRLATIYRFRESLR